MWRHCEVGQYPGGDTCQGSRTYDDETDQDADDGRDPGPGEEKETDNGDNAKANQTKVNEEGEAIGTKIFDYLADELHLCVGWCI